MRMWMVPPEVLCNQHLFGEHVECHMFVGTLNKSKDVSGYIKNNLLEIPSLRSRHNALAAEILARKFSHRSNLPEITTIDKYVEHFAFRVDRKASMKNLLSRCKKCRDRLLSLSSTLVAEDFDFVQDFVSFAKEVNSKLVETRT